MSSDGLSVQILIRVILFAVLGSAVAGWTKLKNRWRANSSKDWPVVDATIHSGTVQAIPQSTHFLSKLSYSYFLEGYRSGIYDRTFSSEDAGYDFVRRMKDKKVTVRYMPSKPDKSFLDEEALAKAQEQAILLELGEDSSAVNW